MGQSRLIRLIKKLRKRVEPGKGSDKDQSAFQSIDSDPIDPARVELVSYLMQSRYPSGQGYLHRLCGLHRRAWARSNFLRTVAAPVFHHFFGHFHVTLQSQVFTQCERLIFTPGTGEQQCGVIRDSKSLAMPVEHLAL